MGSGSAAEPAQLDRRTFLGITGTAVALAFSGVATAPPAEASNSLDTLLAVAASEIGTSGTPSKYGIWYGMPNASWCAMFVSWCAFQAGIGSNIIPKHSSTTAGVSWFKGKNQWQAGTTGIRRGDIVYFDFSGGTAVQHVGIVESVSGGSITTIEGNTSETGSQFNGGHVQRKVRTAAVIVGFGRPAYSDLAAPAPLPVEPQPIRDPDDPVIYVATSSAEYVFFGWRYLQGSKGVLRPMSALEWDAYVYCNPGTAGHEAAWSGADLLALARRYGMYEFTGTQAENDPLGLTGRIIGRDAPESGAAPRAGGDTRRYL
ncbi:MAG: CHAP domain-containing protein [Demequinaceae bacterium]|nr:CHAP domain-containing protein [Demequinaceae bacterium]